jgi:hypothetical protein
LAAVVVVVRRATGFFGVVVVVVVWDVAATVRVDMSASESREDGFRIIVVSV